MTTERTTEDIEAAVYRRLRDHLRKNTDVQNIDLMILADFCRNCLSKWYVAEASERGIAVDYEDARELIYGMPYSQWKSEHQTPASPEQLAAMNARRST